MKYKYSLDLVFSSSTQVRLQGKSMLALSYGWTKCPLDGDWEKQGQKTETVEWNSIVYFTLYDCQPTDQLYQPPTVTKFELNFTRVLTPIRGKVSVPSTPFIDSSGVEKHNPIIVRSETNFADSLQGSTGCNVTGYYCYPLPDPNYYIVNPAVAAGTDYFLSVKFKLKLADGTRKLFRVDPQMIVGGGG